MFRLTQGTSPALWLLTSTANDRTRAPPLIQTWPLVPAICGKTTIVYFLFFLLSNRGENGIFLFCLQYFHKNFRWAARASVRYVVHIKKRVSPWISLLLPWSETQPRCVMEISTPLLSTACRWQWEIDTFFHGWNCTGWKLFFLDSFSVCHPFPLEKKEKLIRHADAIY